MQICMFIKTRSFELKRGVCSWTYGKLILSFVRLSDIMYIAKVCNSTKGIFLWFLPAAGKLMDHVMRLYSVMLSMCLYWSLPSYSMHSLFHCQIVEVDVCHVSLFLGRYLFVANILNENVQNELIRWLSSWQLVVH